MSLKLTNKILDRKTTKDPVNENGDIAKERQHSK